MLGPNTENEDRGVVEWLRSFASQWPAGASRESSSTSLQVEQSQL